MSVTGFARRRRILDGRKPEDDTKSGQITSNLYTDGTPDEIQRPEEDQIEGVEIPGNQFVDGGESIAPESPGVEIPEGQSADPEEPTPEGEVEPKKNNEHRTDVGGEPEGPYAEAPSAAIKMNASWNKDDLQREAEKRGLEIKGTGEGGRVLKADLVKALEA